MGRFSFCLCALAALCLSWISGANCHSSDANSEWHGNLLELIELARGAQEACHLETLTYNDTQVLIDMLFDGFPCAVNATKCPKLVTASTVFTIVGANESNGLTAEQFEKVSVILLFHVVNPTLCGNKTSVYRDYIYWMVKEAAGCTSNGNLYTQVEFILEELRTGHKLSSDHDNGGQTHLGISGDTHEDPPVNRHPDNDVNDGNTKGIQKATGDDDHEDHEDDDDHDHDGEHDDEPCFDINTIADDVLGLENGDCKEAEQAAWRIVFYLLKGYRIWDHCHEGDLPSTGDFKKEIYSLLKIPEGQPITEEAFSELLETLEIGTDEEHGHNDEEDAHNHDERKKRSVHDTALSVNQCYGGEELLTIYQINHTVGLTYRDLQRVCPALLQQQLSGNCGVETEQARTTSMEKYGYGTLAVLIISLLAVLGVVFLPCLKSKIYHAIMSVFVALAVGTLIGDVFLHLLPAAFGIHGHGGGSHADHGTTAITVEPFVYKALVVLAALFFFFLLESIFEKVGHSHHAEFQIDIDEPHVFHLTSKHHDGEVPQEISVKHPISNRDSQVKLTERMNGELNDSEKKTTGCLKNRFKGVKTMAWMVIIGDVFHNFADGLVIAGAFAFNISTGISTSIAVLCHELPHEIGDFAVLINAGMTPKMAAFFNLMSALTALIGLYIGLAVSDDARISVWIITAAAGFFLYVSLADMVPELLTMQKKGSFVAAIFLQSLGFLLGVGIILLLTVYEEKLTSSTF